MVDRRDIPVEDLIRSQLQSEEEFTDQRSSQNVNVPCSTNFRDKLPFVNSTKSLIFDLTKILLAKRLVLTYSSIAKVIQYQILFTELKSRY